MRKEWKKRERRGRRTEILKYEKTCTIILNVKRVLPMNGRPLTIRRIIAQTVTKSMGDYFFRAATTTVMIIKVNTRISYASMKHHLLSRYRRIGRQRLPISKNRLSRRSNRPPLWQYQINFIKYQYIFPHLQYNLKSSIVVYLSMSFMS